MNKLEVMLEGTGFEPVETGGFGRTHSDGREQGLRFVWWSNPKLADQYDRAKAHLVVVLDLEVGMSRRFKLPLIEHVYGVKSADQEYRDWDDVVKEFREVFLPALDASFDEGMDMLYWLGERYQIRPMVSSADEDDWIPPGGKIVSRSILRTEVTGEWRFDA